MWWGMDCRIVQQNIDLFVDGMLSDTDRQQLLDHAASCASCQKALDDAVCLKSAFGSLGDMEPPQGLALSAIKQAKQKKKKPLFAYVSVATAAVAAAIALVVVLTPGTNMDKTTRMAEESVMYSMSAEDNGAGDTEMAAAPEEEAGMMMDGVAGEAASEESAEASEAPKVPFRAEAYTSEEEFVSAQGSSYYKPAALPEDAVLESITVDERSIAFTYVLDNQSTYLFEWLDSLDQNGLKDWLAKRYPDLSELNFDGTYYTAEGADVKDVYWELDGDAFHAVVPSWFTADDIAIYCTIEFVVVETDEY
jgi:hypothetical protein